MSEYLKAQNDNLKSIIRDVKNVVARYDESEEEAIEPASNPTWSYFRPMSEHKARGMLLGKRSRKRRKSHKSRKHKKHKKRRSHRRRR